MHGRLRIGVDTCGTFTDVVALESMTGKVSISKTPSTPADPATGCMTGVDDIVWYLSASGPDVAAVSRGTTVATNALLTDDYADLGFVTTEGFRHLLEIPRQSVPAGYGNSYFWVKPPRLVPLHLVREVPERLGPDGAVVRPLDVDACAAGGPPEVVAFLHAFGHHDDIGGAVPGSMPLDATEVSREGLMVPPIRLWDAGVPNRAALTIMTRNSRMPDHLAGYLDAEASACTMGARRMTDLFARYGRATVEACFDAILQRTTETFRREVLARIPNGTFVWKDYAEHDGVDPPRLNGQRTTLTRLEDRILIDFTGTSPQAKGPINHAGDYADGNFLAKWLAPGLRNLADTPERMAELDVNEGVVPLIEMRFPDKGTLLTPVFPAPTNARTFVILRLLGVLAKATGGRTPADQETIRYTGVYGDDAKGRPYLMREVLGGGSGGRWYADDEDTIHVVPDSRNIPVEFAKSRHPFWVERLGLATDSGGPGLHRGGLGYDKWIRVPRDARYMSIADRSILSCWGVAGGMAGAPFRATIDPGGPREREMEGLTSGEPMAAGEVVRIRATGGGWWGDPLDRDSRAVLRDVVQGKVSAQAAERDYGVVIATVENPTRRDPPVAYPIVPGGGDAFDVVDEQMTTDLRRRLREERDRRFFDRGPGYARLAHRASHVDVDELSPGERSALDAAGSDRRLTP